MKKELMFFIFLIIVIVFYPNFSCAEDIRISLPIEEKKYLTPDILSMNIKVEVIAPKEVDVINVLGAVDKSLRKLDIEYRGGKYFVSKNCWWESGRERCAGYKGSVYYIFELKEPPEQRKILQNLADLKETHKDVMNFSVSRIEWTVSEKNFYKTRDELKLKIIDTSQEFTKKFSEKLSKTCSLANINYHGTIERFPVYEAFYEARYEAKEVSAPPEPKKEEVAVSVRANVEIICK